MTQKIKLLIYIVTTLNRARHAKTLSYAVVMLYCAYYVIL